MARYKLLFASVFAVSTFAISSLVFSQSEDDSGCGVEPVAPEIVDGATSSMEDLVANSKAVNAYIADADTFLDCREAYVKGLDKSERDQHTGAISELTAKRNEIGDIFNAQVAKFKEANPQ